MLSADRPALAFAPMDGITDAAMREFVGGWGVFSYAVSEFVRVSQIALPAKVFRREIPEVLSSSCTRSGLPVQVQILGGDPERMAATALAAIRAGATAIDINFGCPAPTVNRHDGGASLLRHPCRIEAIVAAVRAAVPAEFPVSAKLRLGWEDTDDIDENAQRAVAGGASWLTLHARTKAQGYRPPVFWPKIGEVRRAVGVPVVANGDIWSLDDFTRCRAESGCTHFMIGRGALADPALPGQIAHELGLISVAPSARPWRELFEEFLACESGAPTKALMRLKQWANLAHKFGDFPYFEEVKRASNVAEFLAPLPGGLVAV